MDEPYLASIMLWPGYYVPDGFHLCDGTTLPIREYQALFSLLGPKFGGDGHTTFALPDLRKEAPTGCIWVIAMRGIYLPRAD
ncbi:phage tail protein [Nitrospirillum sp. BR 11163]|uniref:phage tail protein n=1 Tax=Nitrospirillum sp. BR 11163 TaxID=3104323 RepID=UPI002B003262|nr:phage tail protein [Nitrospirillum sp. BR 11163]MEA1673401.1 phage tail protein [Nitrospirillum sp. BR 11163]